MRLRRTTRLAPPLAVAVAVAGCGAGGAAPIASERTPIALAAPAEPAPVATPAEAPPREVDPGPAWVAAVRDELLRAEQGSEAYAHVEGLTDAAGPRLAGSPGDRLAVAWALARMRELGFSSVRAEPVTVRVWRRGDERVEMIAPVPHRFAAAALGGSIGTPRRGIEADVVRVESLDALRALDRAAVAGRIVFVDRAMVRARDGHGYGEAVVVRRDAASEAARLGAVAALIRSIGTDGERAPHTGAMRYADDAPRIPVAAISNPDADVLARAAARGAVRVRIALDCGDAGEARSANVIGEVPGEGAGEEIVLLGAHLDSWDLGRGAIDDGAGVAIVLEAARRIATAAVRPRRTVRVVLFANEENGLAGARAYAAAHEGELARHVLALEADFGDGRAWGLRTPDRSESWARIASLLAPMGVEWQEEAPHGGADLGPIEERGVPVADVMQDGTRYFDLHHTPNDVLTVVDRESLDHAMRAVLAVAYAATLDVEGLARR